MIGVKAVIGVKADVIAAVISGDMPAVLAVVEAAEWLLQ